MIADGFERNYDDPKAWMSTIIETYQNFIARWQWAGYVKTKDWAMLLTLNMSCYNGFSVDEVAFSNSSRIISELSTCKS